MARQNKDESFEAVLEKVSGALIGVDLIALIQLIGLPYLDRRLSVAAITFAGSLPPLTLYLVGRLLDVPVYEGPDGWLWIFGTVSALVGIALLTFHLSLFTGIAFCATFVLSLGIFATRVYRKSKQP